MRFYLKKLIYILIVFYVVSFMIYTYITADRHTFITAAGNIVITAERNNKYQNFVDVPKNSPTIEQRPTAVTFTERKSGPCMELWRPQQVFDKETWQKVNGDIKNFVFSAFYENITEPKVRIIGLKERKSSQGIFCQMWFNGKTELELETVYIKKIPEDHSKRYSATFYICQWKQKELIPYAVSLVTSLCEKPTNFLSVQHNLEQKWKFSLCLTPLNFRYSRAYELVEMVELNRLLGVEQFFFYNYSTGSNVDKVLDTYINEGVVKVIQWHLPILVDRWPQNKKEEVHYFAQLASLNDCLYRNLYTSKYVVYTDLDEFIIPRNTTDLPSLIRKIDTDSHKYGAFVFRNIFFRKEWPKLKGDFEGRAQAEKYKSETLLTVKRERKVWPMYQRSKYIVKPSGVEVVGIHTVWTWRNGYKAYKVNEDDARLHHYRSWENPIEPNSRIIDMIIRDNYKDNLLERLKQRWMQLPDVPLNIPISNYTHPLR
ncbi:uncharacterized protein LOC126814653 [Patella vulgata]|uniref:uncharacterized protein LOC126814653 n=1 Tax=Patella vulgata TaxID=6465 RepID=UPI00217F5AA1|nr:uncharacterized protein LOC126814653 [Patella vulgata]XP_050395904.1 uncharacterized protein LOC126814653 [Patella vulgata]XP_050395905.1 uncharacterized protein LOC126814653 [Patella vulgata]XP_050395907.1 uncharacterized protein LOC126814653 [Patella vulgata]XP_050395908.1 uncharacterized protein LOC126814653 [Patella vulgata]